MEAFTSRDAAHGPKPKLSSPDWSMSTADEIRALMELVKAFKGNSSGGGGCGGRSCRPKRCFNCLKQGHVARDCNEPLCSRSHPPPTPQARACGEIGHIAQDRKEPHRRGQDEARSAAETRLLGHPDGSRYRTGHVITIAPWRAAPDRWVQSPIAEDTRAMFGCIRALKGSGIAEPTTNLIVAVVAEAAAEVTTFGLPNLLLATNQSPDEPVIMTIVEEISSLTELVKAFKGNSSGVTPTSDEPVTPTSDEPVTTAPDRPVIMSTRDKIRTLAELARAFKDNPSDGGGGGHGGRSGAQGGS
ncbi:hypothetical protein G7Z17_g9000 [Cylindrodendrum hubeiense]|uniref:CCHC-type domain-containing protein n=1 Tax=Cylindrodendrum hubeiense TaxID=595255 RepID=A0A9P5H5Y2_9HYPO|nr:hypothetical protein G7Z17_g9000 [Cylindrodendrum hubeiense]